MEKNNQIEKEKTDFIKVLIDRGMNFNDICEFADCTMQELLEFYKENYPDRYHKEIYFIMREENINVFSEACEHLDNMAKLSDEKRGRGK